MSTPVSAITRTASGCTAPAGDVSAECASQRSASRWFTQPSAICERQELPAQDTKTRLLSGYPAMSSSSPADSSDDLDNRQFYYDTSSGDEMRSSPLDSLSRIHKALAHPVRSRILAMLRGGELCVCQLNAVIGLAPSTMSAHLGELKDAGLLAERKSGRWVHYRIETEDWTERVLAALWTALAVDRQITEDRALLARVTALPVEAICRPEFDVSKLRETCCPSDAKNPKARA
jgi:ArsR family transcriptional regulator, arsenate/arsenite/antimonite-responsive transcriptional repressor